MIIYIAGAYRAKNGRTVAENIEVARKASVEVWRSGHIALCPHLNSAHFEDYLGKDYTDKMLLDGTMDLLRRCDAILMLPGYEDSEGAIAELRYAKSQDMPIYSYEGRDVNVPIVNLPLHPTEQRYPEQCRAFVDIIMRLYRVHLKKNIDYSPANILGTGEVGIVTRLWDKTARIMSLSGFRIESLATKYIEPVKPNYESLEDSFLDIAVYAIIALIYRMKKWGK